jgi:6-phosphogluconolactonase
MTNSKKDFRAYATLHVTKDAGTLAREAADRILAWALEASGPVRIALSGGSTPRQTYQELVSPRIIDRFPWPKVHWFWGDERFVPQDSRESNYRMAREAMLDVAPIPPANVHPVQTVGIDPEEAALRYEIELKQAYGSPVLQPNRPLFHICLLGLGDDGHTASLIPGEPVLSEREKWVSVVAHGRPETRITLTYPAIDASRHIAFLVSGESKRAVLREVLLGDGTKPAARLSPTNEILFIADYAAAGT